MEVEFLMRVPKDGSEEDLEEKRLRMLVEGPSEQEEVEYTYRPYCIEMENVITYGDVDGMHTELRTNVGYFYPQINYEHFKSIYQTVTGRSVKAVSDFKFIRHDRDN